MVPFRRSRIAAEGWPWLLASAAVSVYGHNQFGWPVSLAPVVATFWLYLLFRDPFREVPSLPRAIFAPVDGRVISVEKTADEILPGRWVRISIRASHLSAYTVRAPIEGRIVDVRQQLRDTELARPVNGLWVRSDENDDVVLLFPGVQLLGPKTFVRYGERVGQGQRFAYLRFASRAEVYVPTDCRIRVAAADRVTGGRTTLAELVNS